MIVLCFTIEPARPLPLPNRADSSSTPHTSETVCRWVFKPLYMSWKNARSMWQFPSPPPVAFSFAKITKIPVYLQTFQAKKMPHSGANFSGV